MKTRKLISTLTALTLTGTLMAGCGASDSTSGSADSTGNAAACAPGNFLRTASAAICGLSAGNRST